MVSSPLVSRELKVLRASVRPSYLGPKASGLVSRRAGRMSLYPSWQGRGRPTTPSDSWPSDEIHILQWWNSGKFNSTNRGMSSGNRYWFYLPGTIQVMYSATMALLHVLYNSFEDPRSSTCKFHIHGCPISPRRWPYALLFVLHIRQLGGRLYCSMNQYLWPIRG